MKLRRADWIAGISAVLVLVLCAGGGRLWTMRLPALAQAHLTMPRPSSASCEFTSGCPFQSAPGRQLVSLHLARVDLVQAIQCVARRAGINLAVEPDVHGQISFDVDQDPAECALLSMIHRSGYACWMVGNFLVVGRAHSRHQWSPLWHGRRHLSGCCYGVHSRGPGPEVFVDCLPRHR